MSEILITRGNDKAGYERTACIATNKFRRFHERKGHSAKRVNAEALMLRKGHSAKRVNAVIRKARLRKGGFYHFFDSNESLGLAALEHYYAD